MQSTNPKHILTTLHLVRAGLASGLLKKDEVINWASQIITFDDKPDIFFIDLALSSSKKTHEILYYINDFLDFDIPVINGRPLLGFLYKEYKNGHFNLEQTVSKLFLLKFEATFNAKEESYIYSIDNDYDCAKQKIYGTVEDVQREIEKFLGLYKDYTLENLDRLQELDGIVDIQLQEEHRLQQEQSDKYRSNQATQKSTSWWKFF